jgi:hypothetical protein
MGNRGNNAGGFAYMPMVSCERCGRKFKLGIHTIESMKSMGLPIECGNKFICAARVKRAASARARDRGDRGEGEGQG